MKAFASYYISLNFNSYMNALLAIRLHYGIYSLINFIKILLTRKVCF